MQDWAYEVAAPGRLFEFIDALDVHQEDTDIQFTLMDISLQSLEDSDFVPHTSEAASLVENKLKQKFSIHAHQIWYWSAFESQLSDAFRISPLLRKIWRETHPQGE